MAPTRKPPRPASKPSPLPADGAEPEAEAFPSPSNPLLSKKVAGGITASTSCIALGVMFLTAFPKAEPWQFLLATAIGSLGGIAQLLCEFKIDLERLRLNAPPRPPRDK